MQYLPLADELFLVGHEEHTGKPMVGVDVLDLGLAGAVLGELILAGRISAVDGRVTTKDSRPHGERVNDAALAEILKSRDNHPVQAWVEFLKIDVKIMVAPRLIQAGLVEQRQYRAVLRQTVRYPVVDMIKAGAPRARLRYMMQNPARLDEPTAILAALVLATGLEHVLGNVRETREGLGQLAGKLSSELAAIQAGVEAAISQL